MKMPGIYKIQSKRNPERIYIGSAVNLYHRWICHLHDLRKNKHHSGRLQNHYNKYGEADLVYEPLLCCDKEELISQEQFFIDSYNPFFNVCKVAGSILGLKRSDEMRNKMKGNKNGAGNKGKTPWNKGKKVKYSDEALEKMRDANRGNKNGIKNKGKRRTEEERRKMSKPRSEIGRQHMREAQARMRIHRLQAAMLENELKKTA
jgi:group I intron endonuclease